MLVITFDVLTYDNSTRLSPQTEEKRNKSERIKYQPQAIKTTES